MTVMVHGAPLHKLRPVISDHYRSYLTDPRCLPRTALRMEALVPGASVCPNTALQMSPVPFSVPIRRDMPIAVRGTGRQRCVYDT